LSFRIEWAEVNSESVLKSKVEGLSGEISDHVGKITSVKGSYSFFFDYSAEAVGYSSVSRHFT